MIPDDSIGRPNIGMDRFQYCGFNVINPNFVDTDTITIAARASIVVRLISVRKAAV
jgi:hypothetical protein